MWFNDALMLIFEKYNRRKKGHWVTYCFQALEKQLSDVKQKNGGEIEQAFREEDLTLPCDSA